MAEANAPIPAPKSKKPALVVDQTASKVEAFKAEAPKVETPQFEAPKFGAAFEMPKFDFPQMETPAAFREIAEKAITQAKDGYDKMKAAAEDATGHFEQTYATAAKGMSDYVLKVVEMSRTNSNAAFDFANQLVATRTMAEAVELSTAHVRKQYDTVQEQSRDLSALAQKVATEAAEPIKEGMRKAVKAA